MAAIEPLTFEIDDYGPTGQRLDVGVDRGDAHRALLRLGYDLPQDSKFARLTKDQAGQLGSWLVAWATSE